jgi:AcrR family transcriptional regulator
MEEKPRMRGRPRQYEPSVALDRAAEVFWTKGYGAATLDDLSVAMGMGRPSLRHAFGDKLQLFLRTLEHYRDTIGATPIAAMDRAMARKAPIEDAVRAFFRQTVSYTTADPAHPGCLIGSVAGVTDEREVREFLRENVKISEAQMAARLRTAVAMGQLPANYSPEAGARLTVDAMFALAMRARYGTPRKELLRDAASLAAVVMGAVRA